MPSADEYRLRRDQAASSRLNIQHMMWVGDFDSILHPKIEEVARQTKDFEFIDIGTGTGIVPLQLSKQFAEHPPRSLIGLDISDQQFPHASWLPSNVRLVIGDVFDANQPAAELRNRFDVVHARYLISLFRDDANQFIDFVLKLLKPGGYLQWGEPLMSSMRAGSDGRDAPGMDSVAKFLRDKITTKLLDNLPEVLEKRGFEIVDVQRPDILSWQRKWYTDNVVGVATEFSPPIQASVLAQVDNELQEGSWVDFKLLNIVARLPKG